MTFKVTNLFASPVWEIDLDVEEGFNKNLIQEGMYFSNTAPKEIRTTKFLQNAGPTAATLHTKIVEAIDKVSNQCGWPANTVEILSRQNPVAPMEWQAPHSHPENDLVGVYYVDIPEGSGDILIQDPRGAVLAFWQEPLVTEDYNGTSRVSYRIKPRPGLLVLFPNYIFHSVEPNLGNRHRISIVLDIRLHVNNNHASL
jgi:uncharacterized protein (TIGR02466 family)